MVITALDAILLEELGGSRALKSIRAPRAKFASIVLTALSRLASTGPDGFDSSGAVASIPTQTDANSLV